MGPVPAALGTPGKRSLLVPAEQQREISLGYLRGLLEADFKIIYVTVQNTAADVRRMIGEDPNVFYVDVTGFGPSGIGFSPDTYYVDSPSKLEKIAMILERLTKRFPTHHTIIDSVDGMVAVNDVGPTLELMHMLSNRTTQESRTMDVIVTSGPNGAAILPHLRPMAREELRLAGDSQ